MTPADHELQAYSTESLCELIAERYHTHISQACMHLQDHVLHNTYILSLPDTNVELAHLLFAKMQDELKHLFLKESGILFPCIRKHFAGNDSCNAPRCTKYTVIQTITDQQMQILSLLNRIKRLLLLDDMLYIKNTALKTCRDQFIAMEADIRQWMYIEQTLLFPWLDSMYCITASKL
ncbi:hypothetical protein DCM91_06770 [Chitinophaga costaii]|nr:hypothetical protein DCM91_06770 [Chitinophaga costaii]